MEFNSPIIGSKNEFILQLLSFLIYLSKNKWALKVTCSLWRRRARVECVQEKCESKWRVRPREELKKVCGTISNQEKEEIFKQRERALQLQVDQTLVTLFILILSLSLCTLLNNWSNLIKEESFGFFPNHLTQISVSHIYAWMS